MKPQHLTPAEALAGIRHHDQKTIGRYYRYLRERAFGLFCYGPKGSPAWLAMEDCFSLAFLAFLRKARSPEFEPRNLDAFALEVVRRSFLDTLKKQRRHSWAELSPASEPADKPAVFHLTAASFFDEQPGFLLIQWYFTLKKDWRRILDLRIQGYNHKEIARELRLAPGAVRNRYSKLAREARQVTAGGQIT